MEPNPTLANAFRALEAKYGLPSGFMHGMAKIESNFNPQAHRPGSQFMGMFQLGGPIRQQYHVANPYDPMQSAEAAAHYGHDNMAYLRSRIHRDPSAGELYMAHQQGPGGAAKLLLNPNAPAGSLVPRHFVSGNQGNPDAPASQFISHFANRFGRAGAQLASATQMPPVDIGDPRARSGANYASAGGYAQPVDDGPMGYRHGSGDIESPGDLDLSAFADGGGGGGGSSSTPGENDTDLSGMQQAGGVDPEAFAQDQSGVSDIQARLASIKQNAAMGQGADIGEVTPLGKVFDLAKFDAVGAAGRRA